ncbi:RHS repeat-associated core domain-containing protein [Stenotrophomonas sp. SORGH_AS_0282]|uniref:RHS repeat-associated core domain-containing protein n=2 Tax=Stenotrophomonas sp. SORGH_AS_0282 TaxID=3041763 RepID=UPI0027870E10|nr:RHS repeat-associated core domain-containing protein [Stenotrophomonas sp. SORGH_AS_0282]MDQ1061692.1 RHS repeat-associated protein [Stenotrophomonas sp. SORGH_AS_0282]
MEVVVLIRLVLPTTQADHDRRDSGGLRKTLRDRLRLILVVFLAIASVTGAGVVRAQEKDPRFCYQGSCYPTLHQAEAELRANAGPYGSLWIKGKTQHYMDSVSGPVLRIEYKVNDHEPSVMYPPGYIVGSMQASDGICSPAADPHEPQKCADEAEGVAGAMARYRSLWPSCTFVEQGYDGHHADPYATVRNFYGYGMIGFKSTLGAAERNFRYTIQCPGWDAPDSRMHHIVKMQSFDCPLGFKPKYADNPAYHSWGSGLQWPMLCEPTMPPQEIMQWKTTQTCSAATTKNPCFPATGDKARSEIDFNFAGRDFTRHYHSLNQLQVYPELGAGWSHNYADFMMSTRRVRIDETGYLQSYSYAGRGNQAYGELVQVGATGGAELIKADGSVRSYLPDGRLGAVTTGDPETSVTIAYDQMSRIQGIKDGTGRELTFEYEGGHLSSIALPDGSTAEYTYDGHGNLTKVTRPDGSTRTYVYGEAGYAPLSFPHLMTGIIEGGTRYATFLYGPDGKVVGSYLVAGGQPVDAGTITYNADRTVTTTNELGEVSSLEIGGSEFRAITRTVDSRGASSQIVDGFGRRSSQLDAAGNRTNWSYVDSSGEVSQVVIRTEEAIGRTTRSTRDANNRVVEERVSQKVTGGEQLISLHRQAYDTQGHVLFSCQYDANLPTDYVCGSSVTAPINVRQSQNTYCTEADAAANPVLCPLPGLQLTAVNPAGAITRFDYHAANDSGCDANGECRFRKGDLRAEIDPLGRRTEYLEYDAFGRAVQVRGIDGVVVEQLFDHNARVLAETIKGDVPANDRIRLYEYNSTGKLTRVTQPDGVWTRMHYDTADRLTSVEDAAGNRINYVLDGAGNRVREEVRDSSGVLRRVLDRLFDTASRMTRVTGASGHAAQLRYDAVGNLLETENPVGTISRSTYDGVGRPTRQIDDLGGINAEMRYEYAANGQVERVVDPKGLATTYAYDGFGQLVTQTSPDTGITQFTYDRLGNTLTRTDARGVTAQYEYDAIGRTTAVRFADPAADIQYVYDQPSSQCPAGERAGIGRLSSMIDPSGRTDYCYSPVGDLVRRVQVVEGQALVLHYAYAPSGRLQSMTYPDGSLVDYGYDTLGHVNSVGVTPAGGTREVLLQGVQMLPFGPEQSWTFGNGRRLDRSYDEDYRPLTISDDRDGLNVAFGFDGAGNIASLTDGGPQGQGATLDYDAMGRLTAFKDAQSGVAIEEYSYDATGNRLSFGNSAGTQTYAYPADSHRLASVDGVPRAYDAVGNTLAIGGEWQYVYDLAGRLGSASRAGSAQVLYRHNGAGQRILQRSGAVKKLHLHGEGGEWLGSYDASGLPDQQIVWLNSKPVGLIQSGTVLYIEADHLGSPRAVIDPERNAAVWRWSLLGEAFGQGPVSEDPDQDGVSQSLDLRFPGQRHDGASGLSYNYYRDYDPAAGRYAQSDPLGHLVGPATYGYGSANPLLRSDIYGLADRELGDHVSGQTIDCGRGCTIRVDFRLDIKTGQRVRHLHWKCKSGEQGVCGENGDESHDGRWEDAPRHIKECAIRNGFAGAPSSAPERQSGPQFNGLDQTPGSKSATVGGTMIVIGAFILWLIGG